MKTSKPSDVSVVRLGDLRITSRALDVLPATAVAWAVHRHACGDWGDCADEDWELNDLAMVKGGRLLSVYQANGIRFWIITEADRSATTVLLPTDY